MRVLCKHLLIPHLGVRQEEETQAPVSDFSKGSGVADSTIPVMVAEEADDVPGDIIGSLCSP